MRKFTTALLAAATILAGCADTGHLFPIQGPLATQSSPPVYDITMTEHGGSGSATAQLAGVAVSGPWREVRQGDPSAGEHAAQWDAIYGQGYFVAHVLGNHLQCRGVLTGAQGTQLTVEYLFPQPVSRNFFGVALDNQGNVYKMTF